MISRFFNDIINIGYSHKEIVPVDRWLYDNFTIKLSIKKSKENRNNLIFDLPTRVNHDYFDFIPHRCEVRFF